MLRWILTLLLNSVSLIIVSYIFDSFYLEGFGTAILASFILSVLNLLVRPVLIVLTLPLTALTFGLFLFVVNAVTLMITQGLIGENFVIEGFGTAIIAAIILALLNLILNWLIRDRITS
ncbi:phage holin family protein [Terribacillus saccharophilus]|jgi:putative membrane protein|uniref:phage holin family protein n=1 Tax=Terribacillus saccharophilus TaxID=361277 RepID=UPI000C99D629|nr:MULTISPECIES: phage holin family protein [Terribacillus]MCM3226477.1 phage holin family protein [Terribacillus saccharophilus]